MTGSEHNDDKTQTHVILTQGTMVSHYRIVEKIGAGGMGEVYLAEDTQLDRKVALKFLPPHLCQDEDCRARFKREAQAAAKLDHPNIVTVYEVGDYQGRPFFAMQHIEGRSLRDMKGEGLDVDRIIGIAIQLCDGLQTAHAAGITHRDIKPSNIVIDSSGRPKLLDFGLATVKGGEHLTKTGSTLGTVGYMSPEQIEGKEIDARSDLFSLGVVLYELIANKSPFRRDDETATLKAILHDAPEPLARYKSGVPDELQRIVTKLLEKDPSLRYQSAAGVIPDLKKLAPSRTSGVVVSRKRDWWNRYVVSSAVALLVTLLAVWYFRPVTVDRIASNDRVRLAVLPFDNLGESADEYFADGITEEIISRLAGVRELGVIARTSIVQYKGSEKSIQQIAEELKVDYLLEGTIRWEKRTGTPDLVRITPQLIQASDATHLWADSYDRELSQIFDVQTDIATNIIRELRVSLLDEERRHVERPAARNVEAYKFYLRARESLDKSVSLKRHVETGIRYLDSAIARDSSFALAIAELSVAHSRMYHHYFDRSEERRKSAFDMATQALDMDPSLPEAYFAMGCYHYWVMREYAQAISRLGVALQMKPNENRMLEVLGFVERRSGRWIDALGSLLHAYQLNPRDAGVAWEIADTYMKMRDYRSAEEYCNISLRIEPNSASPQIIMVRNIWLWHGSSDSTRALIDTALDRLSGAIIEPFSQRIYDGNYAKALEWCDSLPYGSTYHGSFVYSSDQLKGWTHFLAGNVDSARLYCQAAAAELSERLLDPTSAPRTYSELGIVYSYLGEKRTAIEYARKGVEMLPLSKDAFRGADRLIDLAMTLTIAGEEDEAIRIIDSLLHIPCLLSVPLMQLDTRWNPIRDHPRFQALLEKYGGDQAGI